MMYKVYMLLMALLFINCGGAAKNDAGTKTAPVETLSQGSAESVMEPVAIVPIFDADSAYSFVARQVAFGPRVPGTVTHRKCADYLVAKLQAYGAEVLTQDMELKAYNGDLLKARNIIAQFQPNKEERIMLCAHWDTRPWADSDPDKSVALLLLLVPPKEVSTRPKDSIAAHSTLLNRLSFNDFIFF